MNKNLSRAFCLLHFVELPMKILKNHYIGETKGPGSRVGDLGEEISNLPKNLQKMIDFIPVKGRLQEVDPSLLDNADQKFAYHMGMGIQKGYAYLLEIFGEIPPLPGQMHNARWPVYIFGVSNVSISKVMRHFSNCFLFKFFNFSFICPKKYIQYTRNKYCNMKK